MYKLVENFGNSGSSVLITFLSLFSYGAKALAHDKVVVIPLSPPTIERSLTLPGFYCDELFELEDDVSINWGSERLRNIFEDRVHYAFKTVRESGSKIVFELWPLDQPRTGFSVTPDTVGYKLTMACGVPGQLESSSGISFVITDKSGLSWKIEAKPSVSNGPQWPQDFGLNGGKVTATLQY